MHKDCCYAASDDSARADRRYHGTNHPKYNTKFQFYKNVPYTLIYPALIVSGCLQQNSKQKLLYI